MVVRVLWRVRLELCSSVNSQHHPRLCVRAPPSLLCREALGQACVGDAGVFHQPAVVYIHHAAAPSNAAPETSLAAVACWTLVNELACAWECGPRLPLVVALSFAEGRHPTSGTLGVDGVRLRLLDPPHGLEGHERALVYPLTPLVLVSPRPTVHVTVPQPQQQQQQSALQSPLPPPTGPQQAAEVQNAAVFCFDVGPFATAEQVKAVRLGVRRFLALGFFLVCLSCFCLFGVSLDMHVVCGVLICTSGTVCRRSTHKVSS
mgnify:CR=1 FL=1